MHLPRIALAAAVLAACTAPPEPIDHFPCFVAGTPITMADGSLRPIENVVAGDRVLTFDPASSTLTSSVVTRVFVHPNSTELVVVNETLVATANHPFYVQLRGRRPSRIFCRRDPRAQQTPGTVTAPERTRAACSPVSGSELG